MWLYVVIIIIVRVVSKVLSVVEVVLIVQKLPNTNTRKQALCEEINELNRI